MHTGTTQQSKVSQSQAILLLQILPKISKRHPCLSKSTATFKHLGSPDKRSIIPPKYAASLSSIILYHVPLHHSTDAPTFPYIASDQLYTR